MVALALQAFLPALLLATAQVPSHRPPQRDRALVDPVIVCDAATRVADPKLVDGDASITFHLEPAGIAALVQVEVLSNGVAIAAPWSGVVIGGQPATTCAWNGRDALGARCPLDDYAWRISAPGAAPVVLPLHVDRFGVIEVAALASPGASDEFQMVYFRKGSGYGWFATPATHEYLNVARGGDASDLDRNDGEPRPAVPVHTSTAEPVMSGSNYDTFTYNYPLAYVKGSTPRLRLVFGGSATAADGSPMDVAYPALGWEFRVVCDTGTTVAGADAVAPWGAALVDLPALPGEVGRTDTTLVLRFEHREPGAASWSAIPGRVELPLRFYTLLGAPQFKAGATGTQYTGPWVEVAEHVATWKSVLGLPSHDQASLTELFVKGFFGQNGGLPAAIEGVVYDAGPLGGDGGATHYFLFSAWNMQLSRLLNAHALGTYVNCSDNMGAATTMLSMLGATGVRPVRLGAMSLRAIWGIGAPAYTLNLWGNGHSFTYHHIVTDDAAVTVSDTCMQVDEDGNPAALPGTPGWNARRPWSGAGGYMGLSATNNVTRTLEALPGLQ